MKKILFQITILFFSFPFIFYSCEDKEEWGTAQVYMPQASYGNTYNVPNNGTLEQGNLNYRIDEDNQKLYVFLGVSRSGLQNSESYAVQVDVDVAATENALSEIDNSAALPQDAYSLPSEVTVADGEHEASFDLTVDMGALKSQYPSYDATSKLVLVVKISNTTKYELNESLCKTVVVINGALFLPEPPEPPEPPAPSLILGGDFEAESEKFWTLCNLNTDGIFNESVAVVENGVFNVSFGTSPVTGQIAFYQQLRLVKGEEYTFSADFAASGGASNGQLYICITDKEPQLGGGYDPNGIFTDIDSWQGNLIEPITGKLPQNSGWTEGMDMSTGIFTSPYEECYVVIVVACWNGSVGTITLDNIELHGPAPEPPPTSEVVPGGDFETGSEEFWTLLNLYNGGAFDEAVAVIGNGIITFSFNSDTDVSGNFAVYQQIKLEKGKEYTFSADYTASGGAKDAELYICIFDQEPQEGVYYAKNGVFADLNTWANNLIEPAVGTLPQDAANVGDMDMLTGKFISPYDDCYIVIVVGCWGGTLGTVTLDNIEIK